MGTGNRRTYEITGAQLLLTSENKEALEQQKVSSFHSLSTLLHNLSPQSKVTLFTVQERRKQKAFVLTFYVIFSSWSIIEQSSQLEGAVCRKTTHIYLFSSLCFWGYFRISRKFVSHKLSCCLQVPRVVSSGWGAPGLCAGGAVREELTEQTDSPGTWTHPLLWHLLHSRVLTR